MNQDPMVSNSPIGSSQERRREEAARWFITLQHAQLSERLLTSWKQWEAIPENREAFDAVERVWQLAGHVPELRAVDPDESAADPYDTSVPISSYLRRLRGAARLMSPLKERFYRRAFRVAVAVAAVMIVVQSTSILPSFLQLFTGTRTPDRTVVAETGLAEHKQIVFEDGSRILLGAESSITANFSRTTRSVALDRGEAHFRVAHDPQRPFQVSAGGGMVTAVGTAFNVQHRLDSDVVVTVTEGVVEVTPNSPHPLKVGEAADGDKHSAALRVARGQEVTYDAQGTVSPVRLAEVVTTVGWRDGRFKYSGEPLTHVVEDINRYSRYQLILDDDAQVGDLLYSGTVFTSDIQEWVAGLEKTYPQIEVVTMADAHVLIRARAVAEQEVP